MAVGHGMTPCTLRVEFAELHPDSLSRYPKLKGRRLLVVDTPGFDGDMPTESVFQCMTRWAQRQ